MVIVKTENIVKTFGDVVAVDHASVTVNDGELFTVLGPSGCGKSTFLRIIAGLEFSDEGKVFFDETDITNLPPHKRETGMVFQNYALWPHMNVHDNVAYGLKIRKIPKEDIEARVKEYLNLVQLEGLGDRAPYQLSGGQQQRVALTRVLAINPKVLLFDEPLSNLDAKLRLEMRGEIKKLQRSLSTTTIYVTHDQEEAMSISDRIAIMNEGRIEQVSTPMDIYFKPKNTFVANFIGQGSFLRGEVIEEDEYLTIRLETDQEIKAIASDPTDPPRIGDKTLMIIRPESFEIGSIEKSNVFKCKVTQTFFLGKINRVRAEMDIWTFLIDIDPFMKTKNGEDLIVSVSPLKTLALRIK